MNEIGLESYKTVDGYGYMIERDTLLKVIK